MATAVFSTPRLTHRLLCAGDEALFCSLYTDAETMRFIAPPLSMERAQRAFRSAVRLTQQPSTDRLFYALIAGDGQPVGISSLLQIDLQNRRLEAGILILGAHRARGFAREGLRGLLVHAFATLPIDEVWVQIAVDHTVVEKLVMSVGLVRGAEVAADANHFRTRIWSAQRSRWLRDVSTVNEPGESNVERH
jgi:RimJ/RimL family protein N-acetyltransferase